MAIQSKPGTH
ncbi:hypothetical protein CGLO_18242 [Colletotrichum gloeosporioides Cg-14]|uniref:Uncharacterized protein n=1 Tax=Colletotrichum gloeosporioides (strain Cg-14) TaxID=1237896 RepID=T0L4I8_COLGC|nr:hypothetical protein CGLO_18242 [Colletotrichum gloeosporioides Cg-14]